jgi:hypothetical protein
MAKDNKPRKTASKKQKRLPKNQPLKGLAFINAVGMRGAAAPMSDLKRELRSMRRPEDVLTLGALYDAYQAAADVIVGIQNQPRAEGLARILDAECSQLILKAWTVAEHLKTLRPTKSGYDRENFVRVLVDAAFEMGGNVDDAASVFKAALAVATDNSADDRD